MSTPIITLDLTKQAPHSPRNRIGGFVIASRAADKCRASLSNETGEYHYDCPLDNVLFTFKGITGAQFKTAVQDSKTYEEVGAWLLANGTSKTPAEIKNWSDEVEARSPMKNAEKRDSFIHNCPMLGLIPESSTTFDWLEADDRASFGEISLKELKANAASTGKEEDLKMYKTGNDISQSRRLEINAILNQRLASAVDLQMQMKQAHWNVKGPNFIGLHELFDKISDVVLEQIDEIAERASPHPGRASRYKLTPKGHQLVRLLIPLSEWGNQLLSERGIKWQQPPTIQNADIRIDVAASP